MIATTPIRPEELLPSLDRFFALAGPKLKSLARTWDPAKGTPVFTRKGRYTSRGWTEWTQGFLYGCRLLQFDATGDAELLESGRADTLKYMAPHLTHMGVHDHGFNNLSTYGTLRRLAREGRTGDSADLVRLYELALCVSGAVQAARWTATADGGGFIHSFNGPQSLFVDTIRSCRILVLAHSLGHVLMGENDRRISLLDRAVQHIRTTLKYNVYYGRGRDAMTCADASPMKASSTSRTALPLSKHATRLLSLQHLDARPCLGLLGCAEQLEFFHAHPDLPRRWRTARYSSPNCSGAPWPWPTSISPRRPWTASPTGTRARRDSFT